MVHMQFRFHLFLFSLLFSTISLSGQGYEIQLNAPDFAGQEVILAEYFTNRMVPKDTARISIMGEAVFSGRPLSREDYISCFSVPATISTFCSTKTKNSVLQPTAQILQEKQLLKVLMKTSFFMHTSAI